MGALLMKGRVGTMREKGGQTHLLMKRDKITADDFRTPQRPYGSNLRILGGCITGALLMKGRVGTMREKGGQTHLLNLMKRDKITADNFKNQTARLIFCPSFNEEQLA